MNSSISSFNTELKVFLVVLLVLGGLELYQRTYFATREGDPALLRNFPTLADNLATQPAPSMILLGNSLTQNGYDMPLLKSLLDAQPSPTLHVEKVALSGSNPIEWYHLFNNNFVRRNKTPSAIVINMSPSGIMDDLPAGYRIGWLANETNWQDVPHVLRDDLQRIDVAGQYLQARLSMLCANRWDIRVGILNNLIPNAWAGMNWVNNGQIPSKAKSTQPPPKTFTLLTHLLELARTNHAHIILVAMPARDPYDIDPQMTPILKTYNVTLIDARHIPNLTPDCFEDTWHLNPKGAKIFTPFMATQLPAAAQSFTTP